LIFSGQVLVQQLREAVAGDFVFVGFLLGHFDSSFGLKSRLYVRALWAPI
jgi:hypothetical protein